VSLPRHSSARERARIYDEGVEDFRAGKDRADHKYPPGSGSANAHDAGWDRAQADREAQIPSTGALDHLARTINARRLDEEQAKEQAKRDREAFEGLGD